MPEAQLLKDIHEGYLLFLFKCHISQAIRSSVFNKFLNSPWDIEFLNSSHASKNMSEGTSTPSSRRICIALSTSAYSRVRSRSRDVLLVAMLSDKRAMYSPTLQRLLLLAVDNMVPGVPFRTRVITGRSKVILRWHNMRRCCGIVDGH
jgi:hypothetical protein